MQDNKNIPIPLNIVAILFLLGGLSSAIGMVVRLLDGHIHLDFGVLGIPTYFGLRRFSIGWRIYALVCTWLVLVASPIFFVLGFMVSQPADFTLFGLNAGKVSPLWLTIVSAPLFLLSLWQLRVLTRKDIKRRFYEKETELSGADNPRPCGTSGMSPADPATRAGDTPEASGGI